jgi:PAS domain S-box-containing protein
MEMAEQVSGAERMPLQPVERELERIFSSLGHGMYVVDSERRIRLWNKAAESILGWKEEDALGNDCREFIRHEDKEGLRLCDDHCPLRSSIDGSRTVFAGTVWGYTSGGGKVPLNVSCAPLLDAEGHVAGAVEVFADITREMEVDRLKSEIVSIMAHELRTPLTSMLGYLELVMEGEAGSLTDEQREFLSIVKSNIARLTGLVNDFLDLDKLESGKMDMHWEELDLNELARDALKAHFPMAEDKGLDLAHELEPLSSVFGDRQLVSQVLHNLISNAIKYTNEGKIEVKTSVDDGKVAVEVKDTGVGIPVEEQDKIGDKFFRASTAALTPSHGSGLGLSITMGIIEKHCGDLEIQSEPGVGSTFRVLLPLDRECVLIKAEKEAEGGI